MNVVWRVTYLDDGLFALDLKDLAFSLDSVSESDVDDLSVLGELDVVQHDKWAFDIKDSSVIDSWGDVVISRSYFNVFYVD